MKKWMPIRGDFVASGEDVIFQGEALSPNTSTLFNPYMGQLSPNGIILFEDAISNGVIETTISFEKFDKGDLAQIIFN